MQNIKIIASHLSGKGGTETVLKKVMESNYLNSEFNLELHTFDDMADSSWTKSFKSQVSKGGKSRLLNLLKYLMLLVYSKNDVLIILGPELINIASLYRKIFKGRYLIVSWVHFTLEDNSFINTNKLALADYHLAISTGIVKQLQTIGVDKSKIRLIYNPVSKTDKRIKKSEDCQFIYVGRVMLNGQKNIRELINSLAKVTGKWSLNIIGDGPDLVKCQLYAEQILGKESQRITWSGWKNDPWEDVDSATALVLTSKFEGFGMVLAESISQSLPAISSNCEVGPSDIISDRNNGFLYSPGDTDKLSEYLQLFIDDKDNISRELIPETLNKFYAEQYFRNFGNIITEFGDSNG